MDKVIIQRQVLYQPSERENMMESPQARLFGYCHEDRTGMSGNKRSRDTLKHTFSLTVP